MAGFRIPGPMDPILSPLDIDDGTSARMLSPLPGPIGTDAFTRYLADAGQGATQMSSSISEELRILAALSYGEASTANVFEEMAAIANVIVRQANARRKTVTALITSDPDFSYAATDGNQRYSRLMKASNSDIEKDAAMSSALKAARNA